MLGGAGVTGVAWEIGLLAGLADRGIQLDTAGLLAGTRGPRGRVRAHRGAGTGAPGDAGRDRRDAPVRRAGHAVAVVSPDPSAVAAIGRNVLDPARRAPAARAGHAQAGPALDRVGTVRDG